MLHSLNSNRTTKWVIVLAWAFLAATRIAEVDHRVMKANPGELARAIESLVRNRPRTVKPNTAGGA